MKFCGILFVRLLYEVLNVWRVEIFVRVGRLLLKWLCEMFIVCKEVKNIRFCGRLFVNWLLLILNFCSDNNLDIVFDKFFVNWFVERLIFCISESLLSLFGMMFVRLLCFIDSWVFKGRVFIVVGIILFRLLFDKFKFFNFGNVFKFVIKFFLSWLFCKWSIVRFFRFRNGIVFCRRLFLFKFIDMRILYKFSFFGIVFVKLLLDMFSVISNFKLFREVGMVFLRWLFFIVIVVRLCKLFSVSGIFFFRWLFLRFRVFILVVFLSFIGIVLDKKLFDKLRCFKWLRVLRRGFNFFCKFILERLMVVICLFV